MTTPVTEWAKEPVDLAGRTISELLTTVADYLAASGGGPLEECVREMATREKPDSNEAASTSRPAPLSPRNHASDPT